MNIYLFDWFSFDFKPIIKAIIQIWHLIHAPKTAAFGFSIFSCTTKKWNASSSYRFDAQVKALRVVTMMTWTRTNTTWSVLLNLHGLIRPQIVMAMAMVIVPMECHLVKIASRKVSTSNQCTLWLGQLIWISLIWDKKFNLKINFLFKSYGIKWVVWNDVKIIWSQKKSFFFELSLSHTHKDSLILTRNIQPKYKKIKKK